MWLNSGNKLNDAGIYGVNFWTLGVPHTVMVDDLIPMKKEGQADYRTMMAAYGKDHSVWQIILEKAFAKYHGDYNHIVGGLSGLAVRTMTGAPYDTFTHAKMNKYDVHDEIMKADARDDIITMGSMPGSDKHTDPNGLVLGHAFTVLGGAILKGGPYHN